MTDRTALLAAIRDNPREDTPRLMYADWLDEFGETDLDRATSEFIRVSCSRETKPGNSMPPKSYAWIEDNWRRLLPTLFAKYPMGSVLSPHWGSWHREGRAIGTHWGKKPLIDRNSKRWRVWFEFERGFLLSAKTWAWDARVALPRLIRPDQPLAELIEPTGRVQVIGTPTLEPETPSLF